MVVAVRGHDSYLVNSFFGCNVLLDRDEGEPIDSFLLIQLNILEFARKRLRLSGEKWSSSSSRAFELDPLVPEDVW